MPDTHDPETIFALSTGSLPSGVAVIRISGRETRLILQTLAGGCPSPRQASLRSIRCRNGTVLDKGVVVYFEAPASFTGEDCAELQVHGSRAVIDAVFAELTVFEHTRIAEAGEFSRRAFENGKLDLVEVEGLADLLAAETEMQRRLAQEYASGNLSALYDSWSKRLTKARALLEAELDFPDEEDVPGSVSNQAWDDMLHLRSEIYSHLTAAKAGEIIRDGFKVAIVGRPNAGKSALMNTLVNRDVAIVTDIAGTTRDIIQTDIVLDGHLVKLFDTAGLRHTLDVVEQEGIRRAYAAAEEADLVLHLVDLTTHEAVVDAKVDRQKTIMIGAKADLATNRPAHFDLQLSVATGEGLDALRALIVSRLKASVDVGTLLLPNRMRHQQILAACHEAIGDALQDNFSLDIRAEHLRIAGEMLGRITGRVAADDLLDIVFSQFCIGK